MQHLKILNNKEVKRLVNSLNEAYGVKLKLDFAFLENNKGKVYLLSKKFGELEDKNLRINNLGMYFGKREKDGFRLSIEGAQMVGAKKNVLEVSEGDVTKWMAGEDLEVGEVDAAGYAIIKHKTDVYGVGKIKKGKVLNYVAKDRRVKSSTP